MPLGISFTLRDAASSEASSSSLSDLIGESGSDPGSGSHLLWAYGLALRAVARLLDHYSGMRWRGHFLRVAGFLSF